MDVSDTIQAKSDQLNSDDLIGGPRTYTVEKVSKGSDEQPVNVFLVEDPAHPYRPSKSMRRVLVAIWGKDASTWAGRRFVLYRDPQVKFGGEVVGGIKISHASHIDSAQAIPLTVKRGQKARHTVDPLPATDPPLTDAMIACATDLGQLGAWWKQHQAQRPAIEARVAEIKASADGAES